MGWDVCTSTRVANEEVISTRAFFLRNPVTRTLLVEVEKRTGITNSSAQSLSRSMSDSLLPGFLSIGLRK